MVWPPFICLTVGYMLIISVNTATIIKNVTLGDSIMFGNHSTSNISVSKIILAKGEFSIFEAQQDTASGYLDSGIAYSATYIIERYYQSDTFGRLSLVNKSNILKATPILLHDIKYADAGNYIYQMYDAKWSELTYEVRVIDRNVIPAPDTTVIPKTYFVSSEQYTITVVSTTLLILGLIITIGTLALYIVVFKRSWLGIREKPQSTQTF